MEFLNYFSSVKLILSTYQPLYIETKYLLVSYLQDTEGKH